MSESKREAKRDNQSLFKFEVVYQSDGVYGPGTIVLTARWDTEIPASMWDNKLFGQFLQNVEAKKDARFPFRVWTRLGGVEHEPDELRYQYRDGGLGEMTATIWDYGKIYDYITVQLDQ